MNFFFVHAGMVASAFDLICEDMAEHPDQQAFAYRLERECVCWDAPLRQIIWSRRGMYSQHSRWKTWPTEEKLLKRKACIIHGHTPYQCLHNYGDINIFWKQQHIWFSEDLHSFNLDSNVKGKHNPQGDYRGLSCICLEVLEEIASENSGMVTCEGLLKAPNAVFSVPYNYNNSHSLTGNPEKILEKSPFRKHIRLDSNGMPVIADNND